MAPSATFAGVRPSLRGRRRLSKYPTANSRVPSLSRIRKLREADEKLAAGASRPEIARQFGISEATFYRWKNHYDGGMKADAMKRLKELDKENARLKKIVADQAVDT